MTDVVNWELMKYNRQRKVNLHGDGWNWLFCRCLSFVCGL